ncbi:MAG: SDR family NAD(P)-dependent oxidoreductase [Planctomycetota bacterium]|nr:SDR family NAD(P)-dependent oxidoreductase [Planctomycetota bacterium]
MKSWSNKTIVIAGGSQGLGLEIARAFGEAGGKVILMARTVASLEQAVQELKSANIDAQYCPLDATQWQSAQTAFESIINEFGQIDVLVNAIGKSTRSNIRDLDLQEAVDLMDLNYFSALHCTKAALESLVQTQGHVVNIGSLSCKTAWPFMTPYTASKFALAGLTHQLRIEMGSKIHSLLVCPGPIQRKDAGARYSRKTTGLPESANAPGGGAKLKGICPAKLSRMIVRGCERHQSELIVPFKARFLFILSAISTRLGDWLLRKSGNSKPS